MSVRLLARAAKHMIIGIVVLAVGPAACGRSGAVTGPTAEGPPPTSNRPPEVTSISVTPDHGMAYLTTFIAQARAQDADGEAVTYHWDFGDGSTAAGPSVSKIYVRGGLSTLSLTVSDAKGGLSWAARTVTVKSLSGAWRGFQTPAALHHFSLALTQTDSVVTGTYADELGAGRLDPAEPGHVNLDGRFELRVKRGKFSDFTLRGSLDRTGMHASGGIFGPDYSGEPFEMLKE